MYEAFASFHPSIHVTSTLIWGPSPSCESPLSHIHVLSPRPTTFPNEPEGVSYHYVVIIFLLSSLVHFTRIIFNI
ncbi:hypothetical protein GGI43DRAFT_61439 [Trichoderma evansii]